MGSLKAFAIAGMICNAIGTILLWRSSPSGYAPSPLFSAALLEEVNVRNRRMVRYQRIAIVLICAGVAMQVPLTLA